MKTEEKNNEIQYLRVKDFAKLTGLTTQRVYQMLGKQLKEYCVIVDGHKALKKEALSLVKEKSFCNLPSNLSTDLVNLKGDLPSNLQNNQAFTKSLQDRIDNLEKHIATLESQLNEKDNQIHDITTALKISQENSKTLADALSSTQQLLSQAQTLHAVTLADKSEQKENDDDEEVVNVVPTRSVANDELTEQEEQQPKSEEKADKRPFWKRLFRLK